MVSMLLSWSDLIEKYLSCHLYDSAKFYAERLYYDHPCAENVYPLALCYYQMGKIKQTYLVLQDVKYVSVSATSSSSVVMNPAILAKSQYLLAMTCVQLGKFEEAEAILQPHGRLSKLESIHVESMKDIPGGAAGVFLMGKISRRQHRKEFAKHYYKLALQVSVFYFVFVFQKKRNNH